MRKGGAETHGRNRLWRALKGTQSIHFLCCGNSEPLKALGWWHATQEWMGRRTAMKRSEWPWPRGCGLQLLSGVRLETQLGMGQSSRQWVMEIQH